MLEVKIEQESDFDHFSNHISDRIFHRFGLIVHRDFFREFLRSRARRARHGIHEDASQCNVNQKQTILTGKYH